MYRAAARLAFEIREEFERTDKLNRCRARLNGMRKIIERAFRGRKGGNTLSYPIQISNLLIHDLKVSVQFINLHGLTGEYSGGTTHN